MEKMQKKEYGPAIKCRICGEYKMGCGYSFKVEKLEVSEFAASPEIGWRTYIGKTHVYDMICDDCAKKVLDTIKGNQDAY